MYLDFLTEDQDLVVG